MEPHNVDNNINHADINTNRVRHIIDDDCGRRVYTDDHWDGLAVHIGQLKLLMCEIELFIDYPACREVVYAGAGGSRNGGLHINMLLRMFPHHRFWLWDPQGVHVDPAKYDGRVHVYNECFTDATAEWVTHTLPRVIFLSDIRTVPACTDQTKYNEEKWDPEIEQNMRDQRRWVEILTRAGCLEIAMIKFRLPWYEGDTEYLAGELRFQCYAPVNSTEGRLVTDGRMICTYNHRVYEQIMCWFNRDVRGGDYHHGVPLAAVTGLDYCHDCANTIRILRKYDPNHVAGLFRAILGSIDRPLRVGPHGMFPDLPRAEREARLMRKIKAHGDARRARRNQPKR